MNVRVSALAQLDALDLADWYEQQQAGIGTRLLKAVDDLVAILKLQPRQFGRVARCPAKREVRQGKVPGIPVIAVYEVRTKEVLIVSITHARSIRQPWRRRLPPPPTRERRRKRSITSSQPECPA